MSGHGMIPGWLDKVFEAVAFVSSPRQYLRDRKEHKAAIEALCREQERKDKDESK